MAQLNKIGTVATSVQNTNEKIIVTYHNTNVVTVEQGLIILNNGGYFTNTTKTRMNQTSNQFNLGFYVYQKNFEWFCEYKNEIYHFENEILILEQ